MNQTVIDSRTVASYRDYGTMKPLLSGIDRIRRSGGIKVAETRYQEFVEMIRKAQGPDSSDEALVLDHLGEFYLELGILTALTEHSLKPCALDGSPLREPGMIRATTSDGTLNST